ncbi:hypothetical protein QLQ15_13140 [Lysobacter sp. LF1]|uniref:Uncharacterized protein n=1 Tax=Lysobacter stagni TaxID=3045172 RepID=A0ABT6XI59_9GAMM|nr:hypothetical protein [Lysobacter sp. LF1]MDI9239850.1 hypothetical protein [Lysobacter sp. LF1]
MKGSARVREPAVHWRQGPGTTVGGTLKVDEFELQETVNALSALIGLSVASGPPELASEFIARLQRAIKEAEPGSIRWTLYTRVWREVVGEAGNQDVSDGR